VRKRAVLLLTNEAGNNVEPIVRAALKTRTCSGRRPDSCSVISSPAHGGAAQSHSGDKDAYIEWSR